MPDSSFSSNRTNSAQLPEVAELEEILAREAKRAIPAGKENAHFASFELAVRWLESLGISADFFSSDMPWQRLTEVGIGLPSEVARRTLVKASEQASVDFEKLMRDITDYLGEQHEPKTSDAIFVFGSKNPMRIERAVELWGQKLAPRIFITGGMPIYEKREVSEAEIYKKFAIEHSVPTEAIATHEAAISVADNVRGGLNEMDNLGLPHDSLILVTAWFAMRRSWAHMMKYVESDTRLYRVNAASTAGGDYDPELWWKNENGVKVVFNEFMKMRISEALNSS